MATAIYVLLIKILDCYRILYLSTIHWYHVLHSTNLRSDHIYSSYLFISIFRSNLMYMTVIVIFAQFMHPYDSNVNKTEKRVNNITTWTMCTNLMLRYTTYNGYKTQYQDFYESWACKKENKSLNMHVEYICTHTIFLCCFVVLSAIQPNWFALLHE